MRDKWAVTPYKFQKGLKNTRSNLNNIYIHLISLCAYIYIYIIHYIKQLGIIWVGCPIMTTTMTTTNKPTALDFPSHLCWNCCRWQPQIAGFSPCRWWMDLTLANGDSQNTAWVLYKNSLYKNLRGSSPRQATYFQLYQTQLTVRIWGTLE